MKNVYKVTGLIVLIAIAGLLCAACGGNDPGGGSIPVKVRAYDNKGSAPANLSMARAAIRRNGGPLLAVTDTESFKPLEDMYAELGEPDAIHTPTEFNVYYGVWAIMDYGAATTLPMRYAVTEIAEQQQFDFTKGLTVDIGEIPALDMTVVGLVVDFATGPENPVSFNGKTVDAHQLGSVKVDGGAGLPIQRFIFYGDTRKFLKIGESFTGPGGVDLHPSKLPALVVPFEPKVISGGSTSSVTLNMSWNLTDLVGDYNPNFPYDTWERYRFTKGWWDNLHVYASVD